MRAVINYISLVKITISAHVSGLSSPPSVNNGQYGPDPLPPPDADIINDTSLYVAFKKLHMETISFDFSKILSLEKMEGGYHIFPVYYR